MKICFYLFFVCLLIHPVLVIQAQDRSISREIEWTETIEEMRPGHEKPIRIPHFINAFYASEHPSLPLYSEIIPLNSPASIEVVLSDIKTAFIDLEDVPDKDILTRDIKIVTTYDDDRNRTSGRFYFIPLVKRGHIYEKVTAFTATIRIRPRAARNTRGPEFKLQSLLADGALYKITVPQPGMYALDHAFLRDVAGINTDQISPDQINILGNGGGPLPQGVSDPKIDDVAPVPVLFLGSSDGTIDPGDRILFYAEGPDRWVYDPDAALYRMEKNPYADENAYFIKVSSDPAVRIQSRENITNTDYTSSETDVYLRLEEDRINLLGTYRKPGSGKMWFGDEFSGTRERDYSAFFTIPDIVTSGEVRCEAQFAARSGSTSQFSLILNGQSSSRSISRVNLGNVEDDFARLGQIVATSTPVGEEQEVRIQYPQIGGTANTGWLDYIQMHARRTMTYLEAFPTFRDIRSAAFSSASFVLGMVPSEVRIFDITTPASPVEQSYIREGDAIRFGFITQEAVREFIAFDPGADFPTPTFAGTVQNQNLHGIQDADYLMVYHEDFRGAAERLAAHRGSQDNFTVVAVPVDAVMNEFAGGSPDPTAIRDMAKMLYDRDPDFRYLLLIGDASYDYRYRDTNQDDDNFVPTYQSDESLDPIRAFPSDDYFALLSDSEGNNLKGALDIAVGRLPVGTTPEADQVVDKIIRYDTDPGTLGEWRIRAGFVADDGDSNLHLNQSDRLTTRIDTAYNFLNLEKIYLDAFQQVSTPGGERYPDANNAINTLMFKGCLVMNYLGHGGHNGWAQERCLGIPDILSWRNDDRLPVFITATCSFTGYDEPSYISAGEHVLLNPEGGAVALLTTVRAVYSSSNERLTREVFQNIFEFTGGEPQTIGEIMRISKNSNAPDTLDINARKFALIGDPATKIALPRHDIAVRSINGSPVQPQKPDTIRALQKVTVEAAVVDQAGNTMTTFNGTVNITVFDKKQIVRTLGNDPGSPARNFSIQNKVLFKGAATVTSGLFSFTFVVPKDINFEFGKGKLSFYASDGNATDAAGSFADVVIGGTFAGSVNDEEGPLVEIFMNDENFVFGGTTDPNPVLYLKLNDESGINVVGSSIGHDLEGVLDGETSNSFVLNEFYTATLDDYTSGEVRYPLFNLETGKHTIKVTAWDIANNFSEVYTEFLVVDDAAVALERVLNYPNPFTTSTCFQFEHNVPGQPMDVLVQVYTVSGRLVKTIEAFDVVSTGYRINDIKWDGKDDFGDDLAKGVYLYQVKVLMHSADGSRRRVESDFEKLVILK